MYDLTERYHVHITNTKTGRVKTAKIWLDNLDVFEKGSLTKKELSEAVNIIQKNQTKFITQIELVKQGKKIKPLKLK